MKPENYFDLLSSDVLGYLSAFFTTSMKVNLSKTQKRFHLLHQAELKQIKEIENKKYENYALSQGMLINKNFDLDSVKKTLLTRINKIPDKIIKEIAFTIVGNNEEQFKNYIKNNFELLSKSDLFINSLIFLVATLQRTNLQKIIWDEYCAQYRIDELKLNLLAKKSTLINFIYLALYCHDGKKLTFLLNNLIHFSKDFDAAFVQFFDLAIELRDIEAIQIIQTIYKQKTNYSIIEKSHYQKAISNNDFDLMVSLMIIDQKLPNLSLKEEPKKEHLPIILEKAITIIKSNQKYYFLKTVYKKFLIHPIPLTVDLALFQTCTNTYTLNNSKTLFAFFIEERENILFQNAQQLLDGLFNIGTPHCLLAILKLAPLLDLKNHLQDKNLRIFLNNMKKIYNHYHQASIIDDYLLFAEHLEKEYGISSLSNYLKNHIDEIPKQNNLKTTLILKYTIFRRNVLSTNSKNTVTFTYDPVFPQDRFEL